MENSIQTDETFGRGIRRIYSSLAVETASVISPPHQDLHESIHNTRKSLKFMRAVLRLAKDPLGPERFEKENLALRDMARLMSDLRDAHVLTLILKYVAMEAHSVKTADIVSGIGLLENRSQEALDEVRSGDMNLESIASELKASKTRTEDWPEIPDSLDSLLPGLKEVYQKGRERFMEAKNDPVKKHFHEWRKQVKYLLHQFELLVHYWPDALGINGKSLQQLSDYLGEEHDLAMLAGQLNEPEIREKINKAEAIESYIEQKRSFLQRSALNLGDFIYSRTEDDFISFFSESEKVND